MLKEIPGTMGFLASDVGDIFDSTGEKRNQYRNLDGYCTASVLTEDNKWVTYGVHRLVALAFIEPYDEPFYLTVNHKDSDKTNNHVQNLEWITVRFNNIHASLNRPPGRPKLLMWKGDISSSILTESLSTASAIAGCSEDDVWSAVVNSSAVNGWSFKHQRSKDPLPEHLRKTTIPRRDPLGRLPESPVKLRDIYTGEVTVYRTMTEAAKSFGVLTGHLSQMARSDNLTIFKGRFQVAYSDRPFGDFDFDTLIKASRRGNGRKVTVKNTRTGVITTFPSASQFINETGLSKKAVTVRLKKDSERSAISEYNGLQFAYSDLALIDTKT